MLINYKYRKLIWPNKRHNYIIVHELLLSREALIEKKPNPKYQENID